MSTTNRFFLAALLATLFLPLDIQPAKADLWEFFFPSLTRQKYDPTKTMKAPFAENPNQADENADTDMVLKEGIPLHLPHRNEDQVGEWLIGTISAALTFEEGDFQAAMRAKQALFNPEGQKQFLQFLQDNKLGSAVQSQQYAVRAFVKGNPTLLNQGEVGGRYRWLYSAPVMISIMDADLDDYKGASETASQEGTVQVQVGRIENLSADNPDGIVIESWKGTMEPAKIQ